jgi:hypothetical protein
MIFRKQPEANVITEAGEVCKPSKSNYNFEKQNDTESSKAYLSLQFFMKALKLANYFRKANVCYRSQSNFS